MLAEWAFLTSRAVPPLLLRQLGTSVLDLYSWVSDPPPEGGGSLTVCRHELALSHEMCNKGA